MYNDFFDPKSEPIVTPEAFYGPGQHLADKCIVTFSKVIHDAVLQRFACKQIAEIGICTGDIPIWSFEHNGEVIAFYLSPIGSAMAGNTLIKAHHVTGASKFILFGSCGSLAGEVTAGKFILPTAAYRGEGLSHYYAAPGDYIAVNRSDALAVIFAQSGIPFVQGRVWTTDAIFRETVNLVNKRKSEGCIAVEMEVAGVQAVCDFHGCELYDFLASGDVLAEGDYRPEGLDDANHNLGNFYIALKIAEKISRD